MPNAPAKPSPPSTGPLVEWDADGPLPVRLEEVDLILSTMRALQRLERGIDAEEVLADERDQLQNDTIEKERKS